MAQSTASAVVPQPPAPAAPLFDVDEVRLLAGAPSRCARACGGVARPQRAARRGMTGQQRIGACDPQRRRPRDGVSQRTG